MIALGGVVVISGIAAAVVALAGGASSDNPGTGPVGRFRVVEDDVPRWSRQEHLPPAALAGAKVFATIGCTVCHTYAGSGTTSLNAPDLTAIGSRHLGLQFQIDHLRCPSCAKPGSPMPPYRTLGSTQLHQLAVFLEDSRGLR